MTNVYAVAVPLLLFASAYVGYAGLQTQTRRTPRVVRDKMDMLQINTHYRIPNPFVELMKPMGIRVSIPDEPGIQLFRFHGSLNKPIVGFQGGPVSGDVTKPANGRWSFVDRNLKMKPGDVLHFWVFVQNNGLGYRKDSFKFTVKENNEVTIKSIKITPSIISLPPPTIAMLPEISNTIEENSMSKIEFLKVQTQLNETLAILQSLNDKLDPLNRELKLLREIVTDLARSSTSNTKLILRHNGARIPGNSLEFIRSIIVERLGLHDFYNKILAATQIPDGIVFDVVSMYEKRAILMRAKDELKTSKFKIEEYNAEMPPPPNTNCVRDEDDLVFPIPGSIPIVTSGIPLGRGTIQPTGGTTITVNEPNQPTSTINGDTEFPTSGTGPNQSTNIVPTNSVNDAIEFPTSGSETDEPTDTTFGRDTDQPTDILPTDSLDSYEDEIAKKIDIRRATDEGVTTTLRIE